MVISAWNIHTQTWFKYVCFERLPKLKTLGVFALTIFWHGFEANHYISFTTGALFVFAGRIVSILIKTKMALSEYMKTNLLYSF
jgi:hypothetical protein